MSSIKIQRISSELLRHLSNIIFEEVDNEMLKSVTLMEARVTSDLSMARVYYTYIGDYDRKEMAEELKDRCERVLANHGLAQILLPTTKGCFFGNYEYNDIYFEEVKGVLDELNNTIIPLYKALDEDEYIEFSISY